jgi:Negative regulator of genetic competence, sporulation and motility
MYYFDDYCNIKKKGSEPVRIEKISDKQIRCTLNKQDLSDRELRISELAYGTDKAKALFRDMMQQASYEFGFETEDIPLMIEAIPMYPDTLVLVITKVEDPDELDTRFSSFSDNPDELYDDNDYDYEIEDSLNSSMDDGYITDDGDTLSFVPDIQEERETDFISLSEALGMEPRPKTPDTKISTDTIKVFLFKKLEDIAALAYRLDNVYNGHNTVYKDNAEGNYYLILHKSGHSPDEFNQICNITGEYGTPLKNTYASPSYFEEHFEPLVKLDAIQKLAKI